MAAFPKMKPMLQFTTLPPPLEEKRKRRRRPVKTPSNPRVRAVHLPVQDEEAENWPEGCLKWVSPQFRRNSNSTTSSDEDLSFGEDSHNMAGGGRGGRNGRLVPLEIQEPREITGRNGVRRKRDVQKKSGPSRNVLRDHNVEDSDSRSAICLSQSSQDFVCSQDISLYPSTCKVPSRYARKVKRIDERCESLMNGVVDSSCPVNDDQHSNPMNMDEHHTCACGSQDCENVDQNSPLNSPPENDQIVPEATLGSVSELNLKLSFSTQQTSSHNTNIPISNNISETSESQKNLTTCRDEEQKIQSSFDNKDFSNTCTCMHVNDSMPVTNNAQAEIGYEYHENSIKSEKEPINEVSTDDIHPVHVCEETNADLLEKNDPSRVGESVYNDHFVQDSLTCDAPPTHTNANVTDTSQTKMSAGMSFINMEDLSAMVTSMSVDCEADEQCAETNGAILLNVGQSEQNETKLGSTSTVPPESVHVCPFMPSASGFEETKKDCTSLHVPIQPTSVYVPPSSNVFEVTTFKPPCASTPFREKTHTQSQEDEECAVTCASSKTTPGVNKSNRKSYFIDESDSTKLASKLLYVQTPQGSEDRSCFARETPEHLWCSPKLSTAMTARSQCTRPSDTCIIAESQIQSKLTKHDNVHAYANESSSPQNVCDIPHSEHTQLHVIPSRNANTACDETRVELKPELPVQTFTSVAPTNTYNQDLNPSSVYSQNQYTYSTSMQDQHTCDHIRQTSDDACDEEYDSDVRRLSFDCEILDVYTRSTHNNSSHRQMSILAAETPEHLWSSTRLKPTNPKSDCNGVQAMSSDNDVSMVERSILTCETEESKSKYTPFKEPSFCLRKRSAKKGSKQSSFSDWNDSRQMSVLATETPEYLWSSNRARPVLNTESDRTTCSLSTQTGSINADISRIETSMLTIERSQSAAFNKTRLDCPHSKLYNSIRDANSHDTTYSGSKTLHRDGDISVSDTKDLLHDIDISKMCESFNTTGSSILAQQTPEYMWLSPVVKVISDSFVQPQ